MTDTIFDPPGDDGTILRTAMPQISEHDVPELLAFLGALGIGFSAGNMNPLLCLAHQAIDREKAMGIPVDKLSKPVLLSGDHFIIDGDHHWYRCIADKRHMPFIRIEMDFVEAVAKIFTFPKTTKVIA